VAAGRCFVAGAGRSGGTAPPLISAGRPVESTPGTGETEEARSTSRPAVNPRLASQPHLE